MCKSNKKFNKNAKNIWNLDKIIKKISKKTIVVLKMLCYTSIKVNEFDSKILK